MDKENTFQQCPACGNTILSEDSTEYSRQKRVRIDADGESDYELAGDIKVLGETAEIVGYLCENCNKPLQVVNGILVVDDQSDDELPTEHNTTSVPVTVSFNIDPLLLQKQRIFLLQVQSKLTESGKEIIDGLNNLLDTLSDHLADKGHDCSGNCIIGKYGEVICIGDTVIVSPENNDSISEFVGTFRSIREEDDGRQIATIVDQEDVAFDVYCYQVSLPDPPNQESGSNDAYTRIRSQELVCPNCQQRQLKDNGSVWFEKGEYDGKEYEEEGTCDEYVCKTCDFRFAVIEEACQ